MAVRELSRADARRVAVRAQLLSDPRPAELLDVVRHLTLLQLDPTAAVAPSADLVAWSRLGTSYSPLELDKALEDGTLIELRGMIRPREDLALYRADMANWLTDADLQDWQEYRRDWVKVNDACRRDILDRLTSSGPLRSRDLPDTCVQRWSTSGWSNGRNVSQLLEFMIQRGEVAVAGRHGRDRLYDLATRVYPDVPAVPADDALRIRNQRRLHALGIARARGPECAVEPLDVGDVGVPVRIEGVSMAYRLDPSWLDQPFHGRTALLSPFDRLIHDRKRMTDLFEFDYQLEMFKPARNRRWGYYALPVLHGDRLVGKVDAAADRKTGHLRVAAIHEDITFTKTLSAAVRRELRDLAGWLELDLVLPH
jgi:uncharacterized protein YcaQ